MEHSAILWTLIKLLFVIKIFVLSIFEWLFYTCFTVVTITFFKDCNISFLADTFCFCACKKLIVNITIKLDQSGFLRKRGLTLFAQKFSYESAEFFLV